MKLRYIFAIVGLLLPLILLSEYYAVIYILLNPIAFFIMYFTEPFFETMASPVVFIVNIIISGVVYFALGYLIDKTITRKQIGTNETGDSLKSKSLLWLHKIGLLVFIIIIILAVLLALMFLRVI